MIKFFLIDTWCHLLHIKNDLSMFKEIYTFYKTICKELGNTKCSDQFQKRFCFDNWKVIGDYV